MRRHVPQQAAPLIALVNASSNGIPDFLQESGAERLTDELDTILGISQTELHRGLAFYQREGELPRTVAELLQGGTRQLRRITDGIWSLFRTCFAPDWPDLRRLLQADIDRRARVVAEAGTGTMLDRLHPKLAWRQEGTLQYDNPQVNGSFPLGGRGLELRPNLFLHEGVVLVPTEHRPAALLYPIGRLPIDHLPDRRTDGLATLIGPARARALRALEQGPCTTAQLAARLAITPPSASAHTTALRTAGVITTEREGRQVRHTLTQLGRDLLNSNAALELRTRQACASGVRGGR